MALLNNDMDGDNEGYWDVNHIFSQSNLHSPLVNSQELIKGIIELNEEDLRNEVVERLYGPFQDYPSNNNSNYNTNNPSPLSSPRPIAIPRKSALDIRQEQIEQLKQQILLKQREIESKSAAAISATTAEQTNNIRNNQKALVVTATTKSKVKAAVEAATEAIKINSAESEVFDMEVISIDDETNEPASSEDNIHINIDNLTIDSNKVSVEESQDKDIAIIEETFASKITVDSSSSNSDSNVESEEELDTADNEKTDADITECLKQIDLIKERIQSLEKLTKEREIENNEIRLKVLGIQVKISIENNRKDVTKKIQQASPSSELPPTLGAKRNWATSTTADNNSDTLLQSQRQDTSLRRSKKKRNGFMNNNYTPQSIHYSQMQMPMMSQGMISPVFNMQTPFYQQMPPPSPHQMDFGMPSPHHYTTVQQPMLQHPPPPPNAPPPIFSPPPPPPSPSTTTFHFQHQPHNTYPQQQQSTVYPKTKFQGVFGSNTLLENEIQSSLEEDPFAPIKDHGKLKTVLKEIEDFVCLRIFKDTMEYPVIENRPLPVPHRLITVDGYTIDMDMLFSTKETREALKDTNEKEPIEQPLLDLNYSSLTNNDSDNDSIDISNVWHESPFFVMLHQHRKGGLTLPPETESIIASIPKDIDLTMFQVPDIYGLFPQKLEQTLDLVRSMSFVEPKNEFWNALKLELSLYVNGPSTTFTNDFDETVEKLPLSVDAYWQKVRSETTLDGQLSAIWGVLYKISEARKTLSFEDAKRISHMTVEVLVRLLGMHGPKEVLRILTGKELMVNMTEAEPFSLEDSPDLYLLDADKHHIWMLIVFYHVTKALPEGVCSVWMNSLVRHGSPTMTKHLFMIDWSTALEGKPLDRPTVHVVTNILISMLRYFGSKTCQDASRKPLLISVWRTLINFLSYTPVYGKVGTLLLARQADGVDGLLPENQELCLKLYMDANNPLSDIIRDHAPKFSNKRKPKEVSNLFALSYKFTQKVFEKQRTVDGVDIFELARILSIPLGDDKLTQDKFAKIRKENNSDTQHMNNKAVVDILKQQYLSLLGMDGSDPSWVSNYSKKYMQHCRNSTFAWINLMTLIMISREMHGESSPVSMSLKTTLAKTVKKAQESVSSEDGKRLLFKFGKEILNY